MMGREIKFRAWDTKNKEMITDIIIVPEDGWILYSDNDAMCEREKPEEGQFIIEQFTNKRDSHGVEIYENDVVDCYHPRFGGNVQFTAKMTNMDLMVGLTRVIGNIHENPKLLEASNARKSN